MRVTEREGTAAGGRATIDFRSVEKCRLCEAERGRLTPWLHGVVDLDRPNDEYVLLRCPQCGLIQTDPCPTEATLAALYADGSSSDYEYPEIGFIGQLKERLAVAKVRAFARQLLHPPESILDFGTGAGRYASAAATAFRNAVVCGTDFGAEPPAGSYYDRALANLSYVQYDGLSSSARFDLILARHVLEHTHDPVAMLRGLLERLTPGGTIYVEVPNAASRTARLVLRRWPLWYVPKHLSHFDRSTLGALIRAAGAQASIGKTEMPMMGNVLAIALGRSRFDPIFRVPGVLMFSVQLALEALGRGGGTCIYAFVRRADSPATSIENAPGIA